METFIYLCSMERRILYYKNYFPDFFQALDTGAKRKVAYVLEWFSEENAEDTAK